MPASFAEASEAKPHESRPPASWQAGSVGQKMRIYTISFFCCIAAMIIAATQWLPPAISVPGGSAGLVALVLLAATAVLRVTKKKSQSASGSFCVGLFLLIVAYPAYRPIVSLFEPAQRGNYPEIPGELVFGFLSVVCILRAWWLWTSDERTA